MDEVTQRRLAHNEALFRAVNDEVEAVEERYGSRDGGFVCECADARCSETIRISLEEYARIREDSQRFVVVPGHEVPEIERVVERHDGYVVVEKFVPVPS